MAGGEIFRHADTHGEGDAGAGQRLMQLVVERQHAPGVTEHRLAGIGGQHVAVAALQQAVPGQLLEAAELLADGGLRRVQPPGRGGEAAAVGHRHQCPEQVELEQPAIRSVTEVHCAIHLSNGISGF
ncbi:hypothetical protein D9M71_466460 [compost metagenome]